MFKIFLFISYIFGVPWLPKGEMTYSDYFGKYEIASCKQIEKVPAEKDICRFRHLTISKESSKEEVSHTMLTFSKDQEKIHHKMAHRGHKHKDFKLKRDDQGRDHYSLKHFENSDKTYVHTETWMKQHQGKKFNFTLKRREALAENDQLIQLEHFELELKKVDGSID